MGLGDCPQGVDFVFEFEQKGFHALFLTLFLKSRPLFSSKFDLKCHEHDFHSLSHDPTDAGEKIPLPHPLRLPFLQNPHGPDPR